MQVEILNTQIGKDGQKAIFTQILSANLPDLTSVKLRVTISTDSVVRQAYAIIEKYNGDEWKPLAKLLQLATESDLAYKPGQPKHTDFEEDRVRLIDLAAKILV